MRRKVLFLAMVLGISVVASGCGGKDAPQTPETVESFDEDSDNDVEADDTEEVIDDTEEENVEVEQNTDPTLEGDQGDEYEVTEDEVDTADSETAELDLDSPILEVDDSLYGTKKIVSGKYVTTGTWEPEKIKEIQYSYNADGSYTAKVQDGAYDFIYYYAKNGIATKSERYLFDANNQDGKLECFNYYLFGLNAFAGNEGYPVSLSGLYLNAARSVNGGGHIEVEYDDNGNIITIKESPDIGIASYEIEKDGQERITSIIRRWINGSSQYGTLEFEYNDNSVKIMYYDVDPEGYDAVSRTTGTKKYMDGFELVFNSHGFVAELIPRLNDDGNPPDYSSPFFFDYDPYGSLIRVRKVREKGKSYYPFLSEYEYEDGTKTSGIIPE